MQFHGRPDPTDAESLRAFFFLFLRRSDLSAYQRSKPQSAKMQKKTAQKEEEKEKARERRDERGKKRKGAGKWKKNARVA